VCDFACVYVCVYVRVFVVSCALVFVKRHRTNRVSILSIHDVKEWFFEKY